MQSGERSGGALNASESKRHFYCGKQNGAYGKQGQITSGERGDKKFTGFRRFLPLVVFGVSFFVVTLLRET